MCLSGWIARNHHGIARARLIGRYPEPLQPMARNRRVCVGHVVFRRRIWQNAGRFILKHRGMPPCISHFRFFLVVIARELRNSH